MCQDNFSSSNQFISELDSLALKLEIEGGKWDSLW